MKKKMIIYMSKLSVGGMEKALLNLISYSNFKNNYDVTIYVLYSLEDKYLEELKRKVKVKILWKYKWNILGKIICAFRIFIDLIKLKIHKNSYDVSICYPYQHSILSKLARNSSDNSIIFIHNNLEQKYQKNIYRHMKKMQFDKFSKVVCVSENTLESFRNLYPEYQGKSITINNYINGEEILEKSLEIVTDIKRDNSVVTFINIARHEEVSKKISRIIEASSKLKKEGYSFRVLLVGDGEDTKYYKTLVKEYKLEKVVLILGRKINPYPYLKMSDCFILSSQYEGYGIVLNEARVLDKPIITTDVADAKIITKEGFGILCDNSSQGIYAGMKKFLDEGYKIKKSFDYKKINKSITKLLDEIVK